MIRSYAAPTPIEPATVMGVKVSNYCIVVEGELGPRYAAAFASMRLDARDGTTAITGRIRDEAELRGLLDEVSELGLSLISVTPVRDRPHV